MRKGERFWESPWSSLAPRTDAVTAGSSQCRARCSSNHSHLRGERSPSHGWPHMLLKTDKVAGHCPRIANFFWAETGSDTTQTQPSQAALGCGDAWHRKNRTLTPAIQSSWVKKTKLLLGFRVTAKPCKFQKNHGCTWLQLFSCWHPEQTPLLRSGPFSPDCFRQPCQRSQVLSTEPQLQK